MVVDYDDFIHKDISLYVNKHQNENGWYIDKGYFYSGGNVLIKT
ncbi:galactosyl transferase, partial [Klebsiella pneumoniae]